MFQRLRSWLGEKTGAPAGAKDCPPVRPAGQPAFEPLEPRVLLNADFLGTQPLLSVEVPLQEQAVVLDLQGQSEQTEPAPSIVFSLELSPSPGPAMSQQEGAESDARPDLDQTGSPAVLGWVIGGPQPGAAGLQGQGPVDPDEPTTGASSPSSAATCEYHTEAPLPTPATAGQNEATGPFVADQQDLVLTCETPSIEIRGPPEALGDAVSPLSEAIYTLQSQSSSSEAVGVLSAPGSPTAPDLPGLRLVDPDTSNWQGQIIYLDFDGAQNVTYNGPVTIGPFNIPAFQAPGELAGREAEIMATITARLNDLFAGTGVLYTLGQPPAGMEYSTVYLGGDGTWASGHGSFFQ